jgi:hypothetical protein
MNRWTDYRILEKSLLAFGKEDPAYNFGWLLTGHKGEISP